MLLPTAGGAQLLWGLPLEKIQCRLTLPSPNKCLARGRAVAVSVSVIAADMAKGRLLSSCTALVITLHVVLGSHRSVSAK